MGHWAPLSGPARTCFGKGDHRSGWTAGTVVVAISKAVELIAVFGKGDFFP
jgi:hypothetical protein